MEKSMESASATRSGRDPAPGRSGAAGSRIAGFDIARAMAIFVMIISNFKLPIMEGAVATGWIGAFTAALEGKGAALFVVLAGVGLSLLAKRARLSKDQYQRRRIQKTILKRAAFLLLIGLAWVPLWPADILHFYGFYLSIGAAFLYASPRRIFSAAAFFIAGFTVMVFLFDYQQGWNWKTLEYEGFWTVDGMIRHLLYNGFHPLFPWTSFILVGLWLGRLDWTKKSVVGTSALVGAVLVGGAWVVSKTVFLLAGETLGEQLLLFVETAPMPPTTLYVATGIGSSLLAISGCIALQNALARTKLSFVLKPLIFTGQQSLSVYIAHVILGLGILEGMGKLGSGDLNVAFIGALVFFGVSVVAATLFAAKFTKGPLELLMRAISKTN